MIMYKREYVGILILFIFVFLSCNPPYEEIVYEGDKLRMDTKIIDMYDKKEGLLQFCSLESKFTNQQSSTFLNFESKTDWSLAIISKNNTLIIEEKR